MKTAVAEYKVRMCGVVFEEIKLLSTHLCIDKYVLQAQDNFLHFQFFLRNIESEQAVESIIGDVLKPILEKLSFEFEVEVGKPHLKSACILDDEGNEQTLIQKTVDLSCYLSAILKPNIERVRRLKEFLSYAQPVMDMYISLFSFAIRQVNPVARFLFLYNILLTINGDKQTVVDAYVIGEESGVQQSQSPVQKRMETVYTRLRNEIAHARKGSIPEQTCKEIAANLSSFQRLVKAAILRIQ